MLILNQQPPQRIVRNPDGVLHVHSTFHTIQGEGPFAGQAAFFIRLHGCNLQCPGCDTDYTSADSLWTVSRLEKHLFAETRPGDLVVITGGEPFRQNIVPTILDMLCIGLRVQVETNGTLWLDGIPSREYVGGQNTTIVVSPKTAVVNPKLAARADAYKYVLRAGEVAEDGLPTVALGYAQGLGSRSQVARPPKDWEGPIYLQPMDEQDEEKNAANAQACVDSVLKHKRYTLGFQMHKRVNLP